MDIENYYLDLVKVEKLKNKRGAIIHSYYKEMLYSLSDGKKEMAYSICHTLISAGYLVDIRNEKIENILNG